MDETLIAQVCILLVSGYDLLDLINKSYYLDADFEQKIKEALEAYRYVLDKIEEIQNGK